MAIKGKDFIISIDVDGAMTPICYATDCVIDLVYSNRRVPDPTTHWNNYLGDAAGYTLQVPAVIAYKAVVNWVQLKQWADQRRKLSWKATAFENGGVVHSGVMLIDNLNLTSQMRDVMKFSMSAIGCGVLEDKLLPINKAVYLADFSKVRLAGCPNPYPVAVYWYNEDGNGAGVLLGIADNADDVVTLFNGHPENEFYEITPGPTGCDFNLVADWEAPFVPDVIFAGAVPELGLWTGSEDEGISPDQDNNELLSPIYA